MDMNTILNHIKMAIKDEQENIIKFLVGDLIIDPLSMVISVETKDDNIAIIDKHTLLYDILDNNLHIVAVKGEILEAKSNVRDWKDLHNLYKHCMVIKGRDKLSLRTFHRKRKPQILPIHFDDLSDELKLELGKSTVIPIQVRSAIFLLELYKMKLNKTSLTDEEKRLKDTRGFYIYKEEIPLVIPKSMIE